MDWTLTWAIVGAVWAALGMREAYRLGLRRARASGTESARQKAQERLVAMGFPRAEVARLVKTATETDASGIEWFVIRNLVK